jgi:hypothetical protein
MVSIKLRCCSSTHAWWRWCCAASVDGSGPTAEVNEDDDDDDDDNDGCTSADDEDEGASPWNSLANSWLHDTMRPAKHARACVRARAHASAGTAPASEQRRQFTRPS